MRTSLAIFKRDLLRLLRNPIALAVALGVCVVPCLYAWLNIASNWDPYENTSTIPVAVVSEDKPVELDDMGEICVGDMLIEQLAENDKIGWVFPENEEVALESVKAGTYYAAIVIPEEFTSNLTGILDGSYNLMGWVTSALGGVMGMSELILISMLAGGIFALIRYNGGLGFMINLIMHRVKSRAGAEWSICGLVAFANICTANNTIAILSVGDISKHIAEQFEIDPRRSASLLDTTSCCVQGLLPYGAQLLMASGLAGISALSIVPYLFYPALLGLTVIVTILIRQRK